MENLREFIQETLYLVVTGIAPLLITYMILFLKSKIKEQQEKINNENLNKYITIATDAISMAVLTVSQTYVDELKRQGKFDKQAQEAAKQMAIDKAKSLITEEAKNAVTLLYGDFEAYLNSQIEALVRENKIEVNKGVA